VGDAAVIPAVQIDYLFVLLVFCSDQTIHGALIDSAVVCRNGLATPFTPDAAEEYGVGGAAVAAGCHTWHEFLCAYHSGATIVPPTVAA
jgi:hypothetical protein